jgi:uncharacterized protein YcbK (DUF882 family)
LRPVSSLFRSVVVGLLASIFLVPASEAATDASAGREYRLKFFHLHTGERLDIVYRKGDHCIPKALESLDRYMRDHRTGDIRHYDPKVFDLLHDVTAQLGRPDSEIDVVCGYRTSWSNEFLRTHGHGVARHSLHMQALAIWRSISVCQESAVPVSGMRPLRSTAVVLDTTQDQILCIWMSAASGGGRFP